jgi:hypothetical protein
MDPILPIIDLVIKGNNGSIITAIIGNNYDPATIRNNNVIIEIE